jgi:hypothetical protein
MGSAEDDAARFLCGPPDQIRRNIHDCARLSWDGSCHGWCPDVFDGLGAHEHPMWYRRVAPAVIYDDGGYDPSVNECCFVGLFIADICRRFPGLFRYPSFDALLVGFLNFLEDGEDRDSYFLGCGLPSSVELLVLRSGMLLADHWGFVRWICASLLFVGVSAGEFVTPPAFIGANLPMQNFGNGGRVPVIELCNAGLVRQMWLEGRDAVRFRYGHLVYGIHPFVGEVVELTDIFTGEPV